MTTGEEKDFSLYQTDPTPGPAPKPVNKSTSGVGGAAYNNQTTLYNNADNTNEGTKYEESVANNSTTFYTGYEEATKTYSAISSRTSGKFLFF